MTVHNGVDPKRFQLLEDEPAEPVLTWVGRVDPLKDVLTLLRAFALVRQEIPEARLRMFGPIPETNKAYAEECRELAKQLGVEDSATFEGSVPSSREGFAHGQVVLLSSISEGLPYSVIEAMMCGRPTVSTDVGGVAECVGDAGVVVPSRDPHAFAAACVELLRDKDRRAALGAAGRNRALKMFTLDKCTRAYRGLYAATAAAVPRQVRADGIQAGVSAIPAPSRPVRLRQLAASQTVVPSR